MIRSTISKILRALFAMSVIAVALGASAQPGAARYPDKPIRIIVPAGPGGSTDVITRIVTERMSAKLGQPIIIDNKPGAGGILGVELAGKAAPDGYTLLTGFAAFALAPHLVKPPVYDPRTFAPISQVATLAIGLVAHPSLPVRTPREVVEYAKANPGKLNVGIANAGSSGHVAFEQLRMQAGIDLVPVIYKSASAVTNAVLGGEVQLAFVSAFNAVPLQKGGQLRLIATLTEARMPQTPSTPTFNESAVPGVNKLVSAGWVGFLAPPGTPKSIVDRLYAAAQESLKEPATIAKLEAAGFNVYGSSPAEFARDIEEDFAEFKRVVERSGMKIQ